MIGSLEVSACVALLAFALGCGTTTNPSADASDVDASADASATDADASCGPPDPLQCKCVQPEPRCCAFIDLESPTCGFSSGQATCLPSCDDGVIPCGDGSTTIGATRTICTASIQCPNPSYGLCCQIACQPHQLSVCVSPAEAQAQNLTCF